MMDSSYETLKHIKRVGSLIGIFIQALVTRADTHDYSKLLEPEKALFDEYTPKLKGCEYGSDQYKQYLKELQVALDHHYKNNRHHPEHHELGTDGMTLVDLMEMLADWKAASERHETGNILKSLTINAERFGMSSELVNILRNTVMECFNEPSYAHVSSGTYTSVGCVGTETRIL